MPTYTITAPNGKTYEIEGPVGASQEQVAQAVIALDPDAAKPRAAGQTGYGAAIKGGTERLASSGIAGIQSIFGDATTAGRAAAERERGISGRYADQTSLQKLQDTYQQEGLFGGAKELARQAPLALAEQAPNIAATLAGAKLGAMAGAPLGPVGSAVGAGVGAFAPSALQALGSNVQRQAVERPGEKVDMAKAGTAAVAQGALDTVATAIPLGRTLVGKLLGPGVESLLARGATKQAEKLALEKLPALLAKGTATGVAAEVPTEVTQQLLERWQAGKALFDDEAKREYGEAAYGAALLGPMGAAGRYADRGAAQTVVAEKGKADAIKAEQDAVQARQQAELDAQRGVPSAKEAMDSGEMPTPSSAKLWEMHDAAEAAKVQADADMRAAIAQGDFTAAAEHQAAFEKHEKAQQEALQQAEPREVVPNELPPAQSMDELTARLQELRGGVTAKGKPKQGLIERMWSEGNRDGAKELTAEAIDLQQKLTAMQTQAAAQEQLRTTATTRLGQVEGEETQSLPPETGAMPPPAPAMAPQAPVPPPEAPRTGALAGPTREQMWREQNQVEGVDRDVAAMQAQRMNTGKTEQMSLLPSQQAPTAVRTSKEAEDTIIREIQAARAAKDRRAADIGIEKLRTLRAERKEPTPAVAPEPAAEGARTEVTYAKDATTDSIRTQLARLPENLPPEQEALVQRIHANLPALAANPERAGAVANWLHRTSLGGQTMPTGEAGPAGRTGVDYQAQEIGSALDALEQGKRSETEGGRTAVQKDMFPQEQYTGKIFQDPASFLKFLGGEALHKMRALMGSTTQTMARAMRRIAPLEKRISQLEESIQAEQATYGRNRQGFGAKGEQAEAAHAAAQKRLTDVRDRLEAEREPLVTDYLAAQLALKDSVNYSRDLTESILANKEKFGTVRADVAQAGEAVLQAKQRLSEMLGEPVSKANFDAMRAQQREVQRLTEAVSMHRAGLADALNKFLAKDRAYQARLGTELGSLAELHRAMEDAKTRLNTLYRNQERRATVQRERAAAQTDIRQTGTTLEATRRADAADRAASATRIEDMRLEREQEAAAVEAEMAPVRAAQAARVPKQYEETQGDRERADAQRRIAQQEALERAEAVPATQVSFARQRAMRDFLEDAPQALLELERQRADADPKEAAKLTTRINQLKAKRSLFEDRMSASTEAAQRLAGRIAKKEAQIARIEAASAEEGRTASRVDELTKARKGLERMRAAIAGDRGITLTPVERTRPDTEPVEPGERLEARRIGVAARKATMPGEQRTGSAESMAGENKAGTRNRIEETGQPRATTVKQAVAEGNRMSAERESQRELAEAQREETRIANEEAAAARGRKAEPEENWEEDVGDQDASGFGGGWEGEYENAMYRKNSEDAGTLLSEPSVKRLEAGNVIDVVAQIAGSSTNPIARRIAARILPIMQANKVTGRLVERTTPDAPNAPGMINQAGTRISLNRRTGLSEESLLHEGVHAATMHELAKPDSRLTPEQRAAKKELTRMMDAVKADKRLDNNVIKDGDINEFVSEALASPRVQALLRDTPWDGRSMWQWAKEALLNLIKFKLPPKGGNALDRMLDLSDKFMRVKEAGATGTQAMLRKEADYGAHANSPFAQPLGTLQPDKRSWYKRATEGLGMALETGIVDMHAPLIRALDSTNDEHAALQAKYIVREAGASSAWVQQALSGGAPQLYKDDKNFTGVRTSGGTSAVDVYKAADAIPAENAEAKFDIATKYMLAQRGLRVGASKVGAGVTEAKLREIMRYVDNNPALKKALSNFRKTYNEYSSGLVHFARDTGAISKAKAEELLEHGDYVSMYRVKDGKLEMAFGDNDYVQMGDIANTPFLHALKGGDAAVMPVNESIIYNTKLWTDIAFTNLAKRNVGYAMSAAGKPVDKMAVRRGQAPRGFEYLSWRQEPDADMKDDTGERYIKLDTEGTVMSGVPTDVLAQSIEGFHATMPAYVKWAATLNDYLRAGITRNPLYTFRQLVRDPVSATMTTGVAMNPVKAITSAMTEYAKATFGDHATLQELNRKALVQSNILTGDTDDMVKLSLQFAGGGSPNLARKLFNMMDTSAHNADGAARALIYEDGIKRGLSEVEATYRTRESMNFHKRGAWESVQHANRMFAFFNTSIQALNVSAKALQGKMPFEERLKVRQKYINNALMLGLGGVAYAAFMGEDPEYAKLRPADRYGNFHFPIPGTETFLKIPVGYPEGGGMAWAMGQALVDAMSETTEGKQVVKALGTYGLAAVPGGGGIPLPSGVKQSVEWMTNTDLRTFQDIVPKRLQNQPASEQYTNETPEAYKAFGALGLSPIKVKRAADSLVGPLATGLAQIIDKFLPDDATGESPEATLDRTPLLGTLFQNPRSSSAKEYLYDIAMSSAEMQRAFNDKKNSGAPAAEVKAFYEENKVEIALAKPAGQYTKVMGELNNKIRILKNRPDMDAKQKAAAIERIEKTQRDISERFKEAVKAAKQRLSSE